MKQEYFSIGDTIVWRSPQGEFSPKNSKLMVIIDGLTGRKISTISWEALINDTKSLVYLDGVGYVKGNELAKVRPIQTDERQGLYADMFTTNQ